MNFFFFCIQIVFKIQNNRINDKLKYKQKQYRDLESFSLELKLLLTNPYKLHLIKMVTNTNYSLIEPLKNEVILKNIKGK